MKPVVYNLTFMVDHSIREEWLRWQQDIEIPAMMATDKFIAYRMFHLLDQDEREGMTFVVQYTSNSIAHYEQYLEQFDALFRKNASERWGNRFVLFPTVMENMHQGVQTQ